MRAICLIFVVFACKSHDKPAPAPAPPLHTAEVPAPKPSLPPAADAAEPTVEDRFDEEPVDADWRARTEPDLKKRLGAVPDVKSTECHQTQCRIVIAGSERDVGRAVDALESDRELHQVVRNIVLTAPTRNADGTVELHVFAQVPR